MQVLSGGSSSGVAGATTPVLLLQEEQQQEVVVGLGGRGGGEQGPEDKGGVMGVHRPKVGLRGVEVGQGGGVTGEVGGVVPQGERPQQDGASSRRQGDEQVLEGSILIGVLVQCMLGHPCLMLVVVVVGEVVGVVVVEVQREVERRHKGQVLLQVVVGQEGVGKEVAAAEGLPEGVAVGGRNAGRPQQQQQQVVLVAMVGQGLGSSSGKVVEEEQEEGGLGEMVELLLAGEVGQAIYALNVSRQAIGRGIARIDRTILGSSTNRQQFFLQPSCGSCAGNLSSCFSLVSPCHHRHHKT